MKKDKFYPLLVARMHEVALVPPQTIGPLTPFYKRIVPQLKFYPWRSAAALSFLGAIFLYLFLGSSLVKLASLLQYGF